MNVIRKITRTSTASPSLPSSERNEGVALGRHRRFVVVWFCNERVFFWRPKNCRGACADERVYDLSGAESLEVQAVIEGLFGF